MGNTLIDCTRKHEVSVADLINLENPIIRRDKNNKKYCVKLVHKSKLATFRHISEGTFYRKHIKFVGIRIFTIENRLVFFVFQ